MRKKRKVRKDSVLRRLPEKKQDEIMEYLETVSIKAMVKPRKKKAGATPQYYFRRPRLREAVEWLKNDGIKTTVPGISTFREWYAINRKLKAFEDDCKARMAAYLSGRPRTPAEDREMAQQFFNRMAMAEHDIKGWWAAQRIEIARSHLDLQRERLDFNSSEVIIQNFPTVREIVEDPNLDHKARIDAVRLALFGPLPENETQNPPTEKSAAL